MFKVNNKFVESEQANGVFLTRIRGGEIIHTLHTIEGEILYFYLLYNTTIYHQLELIDHDRHSLYSNDIPQCEQRLRMRI